MSWRRLRSLITHLPRESAVAHALHGDTVLWGSTEHLLATAVDVLQQANWQRGGGKKRRPDPIERPGKKGATKPRKSDLTPKQMERRLLNLEKTSRR